MNYADLPSDEQAAEYQAWLKKVVDPNHTEKIVDDLDEEDYAAADDDEDEDDDGDDEE